MRNKGTKRLATTLLASLLAALLLAPNASAQTVGANSFPGTGGAIAFTSARDSADNFNIYRMNADGFGQTRLTETPGMNQDPAWSADGERIVFGNRNRDDVFQMRADGSDGRNLTNVAGYDSTPAYAPSGKILFTSDLGGNGFDLYMLSLGPNGQVTEWVRLTTNAAEDAGGVVSPDGKRILFISKRDGDYDIYLMKAAPEGTRNRPVNLSKNPAEDNAPTWSPDGRKVAFTSYRPGSDDSTDVDVWRMRATDGANPTNLTDNATALDFDPEWQPVP